MQFVAANSFNCLFSIQNLKSVMENCANVQVNSLIVENKLYKDYKNFLELYRNAYSELQNNYRNEYFLKNELTNFLFNNKHHTKEATVLNEVRVNDNKADLVIVNGKITAYEIKSEYDNLHRLKSQLSAYQQVFEEVYLVCDQKHLNKTKSILTDNIGILSWENGEFRKLKKASSNITILNHHSIFDVMRKNEYSKIIQNEIKNVPKLPNTKIYCEYKKLFQQIDIKLILQYFNKILKDRNNLSNNKNVDKIPRELVHLVFSLKLNNYDYSVLLEYLKSPLPKEYPKLLTY